MVVGAPAAPAPGHRRWGVWQEVEVSPVARIRRLGGVLLVDLDPTLLQHAVRRPGWVPNGVSVAAQRVGSVFGAEFMLASVVRHVAIVLGPARGGSTIPNRGRAPVPGAATALGGRQGSCRSC